MPTVVDVHSASGVSSVPGVCAAIDPAVADVLTAVDVSGGPAVVSTSAVAAVPTGVDVPFATGDFQRSGVPSDVVIPAVVGVPAVAGVSAVGNKCSCCITKNVTVKEFLHFVQWLLGR